MSATTPTVDSVTVDANDAGIIDAITGNLQAFWLSLKVSLQIILEFFLDVLDVIAFALMDAFGGFLVLCLQILPDMELLPQAPAGGSFNLIGAANDFVPIAEGFTVLTFLGAVWAARGLYLLARFIRGGG